MEYTEDFHDNQCDVTLKGQITFEDYPGFRTMCDDVKQHKMDKIVLCFKGVEYMDSAALGMLFLLKEYADKANVELAVICTKDSIVNRVFMACNLDEAFNLTASAA